MVSEREKAIQLIKRFFDLKNSKQYAFEDAKLCKSKRYLAAKEEAKICIDEIHKENEDNWSSDNRNYEHSGRWKYLEGIKKEIEIQ